MKAIKTQQRYRCDFCKKVSVRQAMLKHEKRCFRNPNRLCDYCKNKGFIEEDYSDEVPGSSMLKRPCPFCSKFDKKMLKEIEERENRG